MSIYTLIPIIFIVLYAGYWYYVKNKNSQQAQVVNNTDFKAEFASTLFLYRLQMPNDIKTAYSLPNCLSSKKK